MLIINKNSVDATYVAYQNPEFHIP